MNERRHYSNAFKLEAVRLLALGAATSIEDAAVIARCLDGVEQDGIGMALQQYEEHRKPRTARIQQISRLNDMDKIKAEMAHVFSYDGWRAVLPWETSAK